MLVERDFASSNGEFRRLIQQGGVQLNQRKLEDYDAILVNGDVLKIGKKRFVKIVVAE